MGVLRAVDPTVSGSCKSKGLVETQPLIIVKELSDENKEATAIYA